jgi:hypothetical protein
MDPKDRQRLKVLIILLAVLAATFWLGSRDREVREPEAAGSGGLISPVATDARLEDAVLEGGSEDGTPILEGQARRNPFQYGPEASPIESEIVERGGETQELTESPVGPVPALPQPPPPIPFSYSGFAVVGTSGDMRALLAHDTGDFAVSQNEVLMGRYRINVVSRAFVEIEDLEFGRRQRLPLVEP